MNFCSIEAILMKNFGATVTLICILINGYVVYAMTAFFFIELIEFIV